MAYTVPWLGTHVRPAMLYMCACVGVLPHFEKFIRIINLVLRAAVFR